MRNQAFRYAAGSVAVVVIGTALIPSGAAGAAPSTAGSQASVNNSVSQTVASSNIARGRLKSSAGKLAQAQPIMLIAWPSNDITDRMAVGDSANLQILSQTSTAADGSFAINIDDKSVLEPLAGSDQLVNFTVVAGDGESTTHYNFARELNEVNGELVLSEVGIGGTPTAAPAPNIDFTLGESGTEVGAVPGETFDTSDMEVVEESVPFQKAGCMTRLREDHGDRWITVGQHYATANKVTTGFTYARGSSSALGVGFSISGKYGSFKQSGTVSKSANTELGFKAAGDFAKWVRQTRFKYGKYQITCIVQSGASVTRWQERATTRTGGARSLSGDWYPPINDNHKYCAPYEGGTKISQDNSIAIEWATAADVSKVIGIDLSARTGYSRMTKLNYVVAPGNIERAFCGRYGRAFSGTPRIVVAKYYCRPAGGGSDGWGC